MFDFDRQHDIGIQGERILDAYFARHLRVQRVGMRGQKSGVDRVFSFHGRRWSVEYKTDMRADKTRRVFIETVSSDRTNKPGWFFTSEAEYLIYFVRKAQCVYVVRMNRLRDIAFKRGWLDRYPKRTVPNRGYNTLGVTVPLRELELIADGVICIADESRTRMPWKKSRHFECWTGEEDARLTTLLEDGAAIDDIAWRMGRSIAAVRTRARRIGRPVGARTQ